MVIVNHRLRVNEEQDKSFRAALKTYVEAAGHADGCLQYVPKTLVQLEILTAQFLYSIMLENSS